MSSTLLEPPITRLPPVEPTVFALRAFSHEERRVVLPALENAMHRCGCWVLDRRTLSAEHLELVFEVQLRSVFDLYSALIGSGLELSRDSHTTLTGLCSLRGPMDSATRGGRILSLRLDVSFLEESDLDYGLGIIGLA